MAASRAFLGVKLECCECHNHPFDDQLKQTDFWSMAAFFTGTHTDNTNAKQIKQNAAVPRLFEDNTPIRYAKKLNKETSAIGTIVIPDSQGKTVPASFFFQQEAVRRVAPGQLRATFAAWLTAPPASLFRKSRRESVVGQLFRKGSDRPAGRLARPRGTIRTLNCSINWPPNLWPRISI